MSGGDEPPEFRDVLLPCGRCGLEFISTAAEQAFLSRMGLELPTFCKTCQRKMRREKARRELVIGR